MKKKTQKTKKKLQKRKKKLSLLFPFLGLIIVAGAVGIFSTGFTTPARIASEAERTLQLGTFNRPTPTPAPKNNTACNHDNGIPAEINNGKPVTGPSCKCVAWLIECKDKKCVKHSNISDINGSMSKDCRDQIVVPGVGNLFDLWCASPGLANGDGTFCIGKPVIYLYPERSTLVDVSVQTSGNIVVSDPHYPENGWKNILAYPNGKLEYQGKSYQELFYESNVKDFGKPTAGLTLDSKNVREQLDSIITRLGLIDSEKTEFLDWWVPKLLALHSPYVQFSIIERSEKEKIDHVTYSPEPQTRIEFIAYFKPLQYPFQGNPLILPATPPQRIGFTAVEWGGVIDNH